MAAPAVALLAFVLTCMLVPSIRYRVSRQLSLARQPTISSPTGSARTFVAVVPFSVTGDEENSKYIAEGVVDSLSAKLSGLKNVEVAPANAVNAAVRQQDPQRLARALGVKLLLRGTLTTGAKDAISITVTLDDTANQNQNLLHQDFTGVRQDLLTLEEQIFDKLVSTLAITQSTEEMARGPARPTESIEAYEVYQKGATSGVARKIPRTSTSPPPFSIWP
jgi:TolB-like protein